MGDKVDFDLLVLKDKQDPSVNFIVPCADGGFFEARYVRRTPEKVAVYLSSQSGCNRGCKFCHLTETKQTMFTQATIEDYVAQAKKVHVHTASQSLGFNKVIQPPDYVHYNFMARGEPLCNPAILDNGDMTLLSIHNEGYLLNGPVLPKWNISTIMPLGLNKPLPQVFKFITPTIYYSLYSLNKDFRKKWLPTAMPPEEAIKKLKEYQNFSKKLIKIHGTFIEGENDDLKEIGEMFDLIKDYGLKVSFNLVRYNPPNDQSKESPKLKIISTFIKDRLGEDSFKEISRVGPNVFGSCGVFYPGGH